MNAKDLAIRHGEKVLVLLFILICAWTLYDVFTDPGIRPKDITSDTINTMLQTIETKRATSKPPTMKTPPTYSDDVAARWKDLLSYDPVMAWLSVPPDVGPTDRDELYFTLYNVLTPKIDVHDTIGTMEITITPPATATSADPRISSEPTKSWTQDKHDHKSINTASQIGVIIEEQVGGDPWKPLKAKDVSPDGFIAFAKDRDQGSTKDASGAINLVIDTTDPWVRHAFRARMVVKATGYPFALTNAGDIPEQTILVHAGVWADEPVDWDDMRKKLGAEKPDPELASKFIVGSTAAPGNVKLLEGERVYIGEFGDQAILIPSSDIRFVLLGIKDDNGVDVAEFLVNKLIRDSKGDANWLREPVKKSLKVGDHLIFDAQCLDPTRTDQLKINITFETPFALSEIKREVTRIQYYEIKARSRPGVAHERDLVMSKKEHATDVVVLLGKNGQQMILPRLIKIDRPPFPGVKIFPFFPTGYDEHTEFIKSPSTFQQWPLEPVKPIQFAKDTGPLEKYRIANGDPLLATDTDYFECTDGRLIYWENVNRKMDVFVEPGSEAEKRKFVDEPPHPVPLGGKPAEHGGADRAQGPPTAVSPPAPTHVSPPVPAPPR